nr:S-layer homology domain-containing protein [Clostridiales bacterium]
MKKKLSLFLIILTISVLAAAKVAAISADVIKTTADYLKTAVPSPAVSSIGGEWAVIGLVRSESADRLYVDAYLKNALDYIKSKDGVLHSRKYTEYSRVVLALTACGKNPADFYGYDLVSPLFDFDKVCFQGINGAVWALIALDGGNYGNSEITDKYISYILNLEKKDGGWSLSESEDEPDADVTAMVLTAFSRHLDKKAVNEAVKRALDVLSNIQCESGGYESYGVESSESASQVLAALSALKIPYTDERFTKNGKNTVDAILSYMQKDGSFAHEKKSDLMATEQCFYALVAAKRSEDGKTSLFDMSDVKKSGIISVPPVKYQSKTFDDIKKNKYRPSIEALACRGIINGMSETIFDPESCMTRAQFATIVVRALGLEFKKTRDFSDVSASSWYYSYVCTASSYGIINGVSDTEFDPESFISREQALVMIQRAAKLCGLLSGGSFDVLSAYKDARAISDWAKEGVAFCINSGIFAPEGSEIKPDESIKRAEIADVIFKLLKGAKLI